MLDIIVRPITFGLDLMWMLFTYATDGYTLWLGMFAIFIIYRFLLAPIFGTASDSVTRARNYFSGGQYSKITKDK